MKPDAYEAWYESPRGRWISDTEYALLKSLLRPTPDGSLLDIGCGTGHFTRLFARDTRGAVVGLDPDGEALAYARTHTALQERYVAGRAEELPFPDRSFDCALCVTVLCFVDDPLQSLRELVRVTRQRFVVGLLNRHSLLWWRKGRDGGSSGYRGAHWHTAAEIRSQLARVGVRDVEVRSAVILPGGGVVARAVESCWPRQLLIGSFLAVTGRLPGGR